MESSQMWKSQILDLFKDYKSQQEASKERDIEKFAKKFLGKFCNKASMTKFEELPFVQCLQSMISYADSDEEKEVLKGLVAKIRDRYLVAQTVDSHFTEKVLSLLTEGCHSFCIADLPELEVVHGTGAQRRVKGRFAKRVPTADETGRRDLRRRRSLSFNDPREQKEEAAGGGSSASSKAGPTNEELLEQFAALQKQVAAMSKKLGK